MAKNGRLSSGIAATVGHGCGHVSDHDFTGRYTISLTRAAAWFDPKPCQYCSATDHVDAAEVFAEQKKAYNLLLAELVFDAADLSLRCVLPKVPVDYRGLLSFTGGQEYDQRLFHPYTGTPPDFVLIQDLSKTRKPWVLTDYGTAVAGDVSAVKERTTKPGSIEQLLDWAQARLATSNTTDLGAASKITGFAVTVYIYEPPTGGYDAQKAIHLWSGPVTAGPGEDHEGC